MSESSRPWMSDACSLVEAFRAGTITPTEALDLTIEAIEASELNAFAHLDTDGARRTAASADVSLPFGGVPIGVKELDPVAGWPYSEASLVFEDRISALHLDDGLPSRWRRRDPGRFDRPRASSVGSTTPTPGSTGRPATPGTPNAHRADPLAAPPQRSPAGSSLSAPPGTAAVRSGSRPGSRACSD